MNARNSPRTGGRVSDAEARPTAAAPEAARVETGWKVGREFLPFHPDASHVPPDFRDGWNKCYEAAVESVARALPPAGVAGWLNVDGERILTAKQKTSMERHQGAAGQTAARGYTIPLVPGSLPASDVEQLLQRIESAVRYAGATLAPGNLGDRQGDWARVHAGRAGSSDTQLRLALQELAQLRALITAKRTPAPDGCTRLEVVTRHPQDYVLKNEEDGTTWRGTSDGRWTHE